MSCDYCARHWRRTITQGVMVHLSPYGEAPVNCEYPFYGAGMQVAEEIPDIIFVNECEDGESSIRRSRFRRIWNEFQKMKERIVDLEKEKSIHATNRGIFTIFAHASLAADGTIDLDIATASQNPKAGAKEIAPHDSAEIQIHQAGK